MQLFARYYHTENLFAQITTPFGSDVEGVSVTDLMRLGVGYSVKVWNWVRVEAGYSMLISADVNEIVPQKDSNLTQFTAAMLVTKIIAARINKMKIGD